MCQCCVKVEGKPDYHSTWASFTLLLCSLFVGQSMPPPFHIFLLLFFLNILLFPFPCVASLRLCPSECECYKHANLVDCQNQGFVHIPKGLPHGTWLLKLGGNNLTVIGTHAFTGLWSLRVLDISISQIEALRPQVPYILVVLGRFFCSFGFCRLTCESNSFFLQCNFQRWKNVMCIKTKCNDFTQALTCGDVWNNDRV